jgi:hypothetical protein
MQSFIPLFLLLFFSGCGYHMGQGGIAAKYSTISVPYVDGDDDGDFTSALIKELSTTGPLTYWRTGGDLLLKVSLIDFRDDNIGFRYDRHKDGKIKNAIIPVETRLEADAEVTLIDTACDKVIMGPLIITADIEFDHDYYSSRNAVNVFSLGQLTDYDEAYDAAEPVLNKALSQKIVDYLYDSW